MTKSGDDMSKLFKSLGADDSKIQASSKNAAREAEQRWPIFKAISPKMPAPTIALSEEEREHWNRREKPEPGTRKRALSMPGLSSKLASSLSKLAGASVPATAAEPPPRLSRSTPAPLPSMQTKRVASRGSAQEIPNEPVQSTRPLFARVAAPEPDRDEKPAIGLFAKKADDAIVTEPDLPDAGGDQSLSGIFGRLEGKDASVKKTATKRTSFLGRLDRG